MKIGKKVEEKSRLLRVSFEDTTSKIKVLQSAKQVRSTEFRNTFISSNLTKVQQQLEYELQKELKYGRENGETSLMISKGQVGKRSSFRKFQANRQDQ